MAVGNQPNGLAASAGPGPVQLARAAWRDPGGHGLGRHPPIPVLPSCRPLWLLGAVRVIAGHHVGRAPAPQRGAVRLRVRSEHSLAARIRIEDQLQAEQGKAYPVCTGGNGACPPEDCGGPANFLASRDDMLSVEALDDLGTMAQIIGQVVVEHRPEVLDNEETRWHLERAAERSKARERAEGRPFLRRKSTIAFVAAITASSCASSGDALRPAHPGVFCETRSDIIRVGAMRVRILVQIGNQDEATEATELAVFDKAAERLEDVGLSIAEGKNLLAAVQRRIVETQAAAWSARHRNCAICGRRRRNKGSYPVVFRSLFGDVRLASPRLYRCPCQGGNGAATVSPLLGLLAGHVAPERLYLETRWAALAPYAKVAELLSDVLPIDAGANGTTVRAHVLRVAERAEDELGEERVSFIDGCPRDWQELPLPEGRIIVGLDGGYVRDWTERTSNFQLIVGRSMPEDRPARYLGLVHGHDAKPKRRLVDVLASQGLQANQDITFLTDGAEEIRSLTEFVSPCSEHVLDWFHVAMRLTVLGQYAKGVAQCDPALGERLLADIERIKWLLWHGNIHRALPAAQFLQDDAEGLEVDYPNRGKFARSAGNSRSMSRTMRTASSITGSGTVLVNGFVGFGRIDGERRDQQALRQTAADAVDSTRRAFAHAAADAHPRPHAPPDV